MSQGNGDARYPASSTEGGQLVAICGDADAPLLLERARALSRAKVDTEGKERCESYIRFRLGAEAQYGIPYGHAEEIVYVGAISRVPCTPSFVRGVINRRGDMLTVLDLKELFAVDGPDNPQDARIVVVSAAGVTVGLLVDEVVDNDEYHPEQLDRPLFGGRLPRAEHVLGLHAGTVALLDLDSLLADRELFDLET